MKSWTDKRDNHKHKPEVVELTGDAIKGWCGSKMYIYTPLEIQAVIAKIPEDRLVLVSEIGDYLAKRSGTDVTCPLTTGIFMNIVANALWEETQLEGKVEIPWWRVVKDKGDLIEKFPK